jgi:hypothetical protein
MDELFSCRYDLIPLRLFENLSYSSPLFFSYFFNLFSIFSDS